MRYLRVKNFEKYQSGWYERRLDIKDASPRWIKLHASLFNDRDFLALSQKDRGDLILLWVLASQLDNLLPYDPNFLQLRLMAQNPINLEQFIQEGWLIEIDNKIDNKIDNRRGNQKGHVPTRRDKKRKDKIRKEKKRDDSEPYWSNPLSSLPEDFQLTEDRKAKALAYGFLHPEEEFTNFRLYYSARGKRFANWEAKWEEWLIKGKDRPGAKVKKPDVSLEHFFEER